MILKCMGKQRAGFLSGAPYEANVNGEPSKRPMRGRIVFGVSGLLYFVFTMTLIFAGYGNLEQTTDDMVEGARVSFIVAYHLYHVVLSFSGVAISSIGLTKLILLIDNFMVICDLSSSDKISLRMQVHY